MFFMAASNPGVNLRGIALSEPRSRQGKGPIPGGSAPAGFLAWRSRFEGRAHH
jgi:hypothetical protein